MSESMSLLDKLLLLKLSTELRDKLNSVKATDFDKISTYRYLIDYGFSMQAITRFFVPFFGGIFLDRKLQTSAELFRYYYAMLSIGQACVPENGMQAIPDQILESIFSVQKSNFTLLLNTPVKSISKRQESVSGVMLENGESLNADAIVLALDNWNYAKLISKNAMKESLGSNCFYFYGDKPVLSGNKIYLNANENALVNNLQQLTNITSSYSKNGKHLLGATVLGKGDLQDQELINKVRKDIDNMLGSDAQAKAEFANYSFLKNYYIPMSQFEQQPGSVQSRMNDCLIEPNLYAAGEWTEYSSIDGAILSGINCADKLLATSKSISG
jgi:protoporphyrinogen oxidase